MPTAVPENLTRDQYLYLAKLAEQSERYEEMVNYMQKLVVSTTAASGQLTVEERNLLSVAYKNVIGSLRAAWRIVSSIEQKEEGRKNEEHVALVKQYRSNVESELSDVCKGVLNLLDTHLVPSATASEAKVFYLKMKGDYHRYLAEFKAGSERKEAAEDTLIAYKAAQMKVENVDFSGAPDFSELSRQMALGSMSGANEATPIVEGSATPTAEGSATTRKRNAKWTTTENLVLLNGWIKYETYSVVGRNGDAYWGKIADYCNEHCSFDPPRDAVACRNRHNYMNKILGKWIGAYDNAKRMQQIGWSENDVLAKAHELYTSGNNANFTLMSEWHALRDQPRYVSQVGGNTRSGNSGAKRARESDVGDSNSVGSIPHPMGMEATKKKGKKEEDKGVGLEVVNEEWTEFKQFKEKELERLDKIVTQQEERNKLMKDKNQSRKMKMWMKLSEKEHLDDRSKQLFEMLGVELFGE